MEREEKFNVNRKNDGRVKEPNIYHNFILVVRGLIHVYNMLCHPQKRGFVEFLSI